HALAVTLDQLVAPLFQIEQRQQLSAPMLDVLPVLAVQSADESQKLDAGELLVNEGAIGNESKNSFCRDWVGGDVDSANAHGASGWPEDSRDHSERCRLAGSVGAEKAEQLALWDAKIYRVDGGERAVTLGE